MLVGDQVTDRAAGLDSLLFEICESLQLTPAQHRKAVQRYTAIARTLDGPGTTFAHIESNLYPQGSMKLGTTVKPIDGPHDLDFVCEFNVSHTKADPMRLLYDMYAVFKGHGVYGGMVELKNRCVRIVYKDEFYLDVLPACRDLGNGGACIQVPDCELQNWTPSNPVAFATWFEKATHHILVQRPTGRVLVMDHAASIQPIPKIEATEDKTVLQLVVQLLKRWRDIHYSDSSFPPISVVLTTLAAGNYRGEASLSEALLVVLERIVRRLDAARVAGHRLQVPNPVHPDEDFSERWNDNLRAYSEFDFGIRHLASAWRVVCISQGNPNRDLERLFGEVVNTALIKQARDFQGIRERGGLGIRESGRIVPVASALTPMLRNTNHGAE
jgi:Second Messenger Oligonucleotide or Dinucleotide Synthetase domain